MRFYLNVFGFTVKVRYSVSRSLSADSMCMLLNIKHRHLLILNFKFNVLKSNEEIFNKFIIRVHKQEINVIHVIITKRIKGLFANNN